MNQTIDSATTGYMELTRGFPSLTREEEEVVVERFRRSRDRDAANRLVRAHLRDVVFIARKHRFYGMPMCDLIAEGNLGLMRALDKFDPAHGVRFGTYAAHWIRAFVVTHILRSWSLIGGRTGVLRSSLFFRLRRERARLESLHGRNDDTVRLLAARMNVTEEQLSLMLERLDTRDLSLDARAHPESTATLGDQLSSSDDAERAFDQSRLRDRLATALRDALQRLDARERLIAEARWLADSDDELSLADIGRKLGVSRERARQLETRARMKLRRTLIEQHGVTADWLAVTAA